MKNPFTHLLAGFDYYSGLEFLQSLVPTLKYNMLVIFMFFFSIPLSVIDTFFGLDAMAVLGLLLAMALELFSGIWASRILKQPFESRRLSRFSFKSVCYLLLIAIPYLVGTSYRNHGNEFAATVFEWLHVFLVSQIVLEHVTSILENVAVIQGKDKSFWIKSIKTKFDNMLKVNE